MTVIVIGVIQIIGTAAAESDTASDPSEDGFEEIRLRIATLEQNNRQLRIALLKRSDDPFVSVLPDALIADVPPAPEQSELDDAKPAGNDEIESLVEGMMRRINAELKTASEVQNRRDFRRWAANLEAKATKKKPTPMNANFGNNNMSYTSNDGNFKWHFGGTVQLDFIAPQSTASNIAGFGPPNTNLTQDSTNFRRLRTRADGTMYGWIDYVLETEYSSNIQNTNNGAQSLADNGLRSVGAAERRTAGWQYPEWNSGCQRMDEFQADPRYWKRSCRQSTGLVQSRSRDGSARFADFMERAPPP